MSHVSDEELSHLKTKLGNTCDKYSQIHVPYKYEKVTSSSLIIITFTS